MNPMLNNRISVIAWVTDKYKVRKANFRLLRQMIGTVL